MRSNSSHRLKLNNRNPHHSSNNNRHRNISCHQMDLKVCRLGSNTHNQPHLRNNNNFRLVAIVVVLLNSSNRLEVQLDNSNVHRVVLHQLNNSNNRQVDRHMLIAAVINSMDTILVILHKANRTSLNQAIQEIWDILHHKAIHQVLVVLKPIIIVECHQLLPLVDHHQQ